MGQVTVLIPWGGSCERRQDALEWVTDRYRAERPGWDVRVAEIAGRWCKADAILHGLDGAREIVVVADGDSWCDGTAAAVAAVEHGAPWAVPHRLVHRLTPAATVRALAGKTPLDRLECRPRPYRGTAGGGIVVARRDTLLEVPPDRRFVGWGGEDGAWRDALRTLAGLEWRQTRAPLIHLHHPPQTVVRKASPGNVALAGRYMAARQDRRAMRALLAEAAAA